MLWICWEMHGHMEDDILQNIPTTPATFPLKSSWTSSLSYRQRKSIKYATKRCPLAHDLFHAILINWSPPTPQNSIEKCTWSIIEHILYKIWSSNLEACWLGQYKEIFWGEIFTILWNSWTLMFRKAQVHTTGPERAATEVVTKKKITTEAPQRNARYWIHAQDRTVELLRDSTTQNISGLDWEIVNWTKHLQECVLLQQLQYFVLVVQLRNVDGRLSIQILQSPAAE